MTKGDKFCNFPHRYDEVTGKSEIRNEVGGSTKIYIL